jgi:hypothetical protein
LDTEEDLMATNCTSEEMPARRNPREEVLGWVASALRSERLLASLHADDESADA